MFPMQTFLPRFYGILAALDELADGAAASSEDLEDLNAELEDALMLIDALKPEDEREELLEALEDVRALAGDYQALAKDEPRVAVLARQLAMAADMAISNLG